MFYFNQSLTITRQRKELYPILGLKKVVLFSEIGRLKIYHSPVRLIECVSEYKFLISKKTNKKNKQANSSKKTKQKKTKKQKKRKKNQKK